MSDSVSGGMGDSIGGAAQRIAGGVHNAAEQVGHVACRAHNGVGEVREVIRAQPITAALVVFALGYLFGRLGSLNPDRRSDTARLSAAIVTSATPITRNDSAGGHGAQRIEHRRRHVGRHAEDLQRQRVVLPAVSSVRANSS